MSRPLMLFVTLLGMSAAAAQTALDRAGEVEALYRSLEYEQCLESARRGLRVKGSSEVRARIELFAGLCAHGLGQSQRATEHVTRALQLNPQISVPNDVSPKVLFFFRELRASLPPPAEPPRASASASKADDASPAPRRTRRGSRSASRSGKSASEEKSARVEAPPEAGSDESAVASREAVPGEAAGGDAGRGTAPEALSGTSPAESDASGTPTAERDSSQSTSAGEPLAESDAGSGNSPPNPAARGSTTLAGALPDAAPLNPALDVKTEPRVERPRSRLPLYLGGGSLVALGAGLGFGAHAAATANLANDDARFEREAHELAGTARASMVAANVAFTLAAGAAVGAVVTYLLEPEEPQR